MIYPVTGLRLRLRRTPVRVALGVASLIPIAWSVVSLIPVVATSIADPSQSLGVAFAVDRIFWPLVFGWAGQRMFFEVQTVTLEGPTLVVRSRSYTGTAYARRIGFDRVGAQRFQVVRLKGDDAHPDYRPAWQARLVLASDAGTPMLWAGQTLTLDEAEEACAIVNRFIDDPHSSPAPLDDAPIWN